MSKTIWNKAPKKNRMSKSQLREYRLWLYDIGYCQLCGSSDLDVPHHVGIGINRNDYEQILLCVNCHRKVHNSLFSWHITPNTNTMKQIAKENWENFNA